MQDVCSPINKPKGPVAKNPASLTKVRHGSVYDAGGASKPPLSAGSPRPSPGDPDPFRYMTGTISVDTRK
jgi:hypothetical protein